MNEAFDIAPGINATEWHKLDLDDPMSHDWEKAINIFRTRITERYIEPVQILLDLEDRLPASNRKYGFTILAIDSLLIETLWAFKRGLCDTKGKSRKAFLDFLVSENAFGFSEEQAARFYEDYRCGILHQAEIGNNSKVWSVGPLIHAIDNELIINRTSFHRALTECFVKYCTDLADAGNSDLRTKFRKKMDYISRVDHYGQQ